MVTTQGLQGLEIGKAASATQRWRGRGLRQVWKLLGQRQRARCWALLFLSSQYTDDQGEQKSKTSARFSTRASREWGCRSLIQQNFTSSQCKGLRSIWKRQKVNK